MIGPSPGSEAPRWPPFQFDRALVRKYDGPGPRYTSYPAAPAFRESFGPTEHGALLAASAQGGAPLSLYVHIPFCATRCLFCGCNVVISRDRTWGERYLPLLEREMAMAAGPLDAARREVVQVHWGGGTPTFLPPRDLTALMAAIRRHFRLAQGCEISVEVDPREASPEHLDALAAAGVGRLSLGVQDLDATVQRAVRRVQTAAGTRQVLADARERGIAGVNVDLIYGLPHQTVPGFLATVRDVLAMAPDRLAVFNFAYLPSRLRHQRAIDPAALPGPEEKLALLEAAAGAITAAGYVFIGMDHFARPDDPLAQAVGDGTVTRNFQGYSTHAGSDLAGFGVSAISALGGGYAQSHRALGAYRAAIAAGTLATERGLELTAEDRLRRDVILDLMCSFALAKGPIEERHGIDFDRHFAAELQALAPLAADGLVELGRERLTVTPRGRLLLRNVAMAFDAYLGAQPGVLYSRTV